MTSANDRQVGGGHYKTGGEEHWDRQYRLNGPGYFIGCITKYVERYRSKNGIEDLEKAQHFLEKLIELERERYRQTQGVALPDMAHDEARQRMYDYARSKEPVEAPADLGLPSPFSPAARGA